MNAQAKKRIRWWLPGLALSLLAAAGGAAWLMRSGRPVREGELRLPGLHAPVEVRWDRYGVPHLKGDSGRDLALALGFLHANDRMTQLELGRRAAAGRLSEVFGEATLAVDVEARTLRLRRAAEATSERLGPESREWFAAYAEGVNAWLASRGSDLPPTLKLFGVRPEPWTPVDSLGFVFLMARDLSFWQGRPEELRFEWLRRFGPERTRDLLGEPDLHIPEAILALARSQPTTGDGGGGHAGEPALSLPRGSNNWALGLSRSAEGLPLVANDLHLPMRLPGLWYQAHFRAPDYEVMGITLPGVPGVIVGQNRDLAWALTNTMMDDQDLFFEDLDAERGRVRRGDAWVPVTTERVEIGVRGRPSVPLTLSTTDRGPLLPADPSHKLPARSLVWSAYLEGDPLAAFVHLARARRVADIPAGITDFVCPAQNLVVADREGGLLHGVLGRIPHRRRGDGRLPAPGWDTSYGWDGLREAGANPQVAPTDDALVTANDDIRPPGGASALVGDFDIPARTRRIREMLAEKPRWRAEELAAMQADVVSVYARELVALSAGAHAGAAGRAYENLARWDGRMAAQGVSALFAAYEHALTAAIFGDELDLSRVSGPVRRTWLLRIMRGEMDPAWFDDVRTPEREGRAAVVEKALGEAWTEGVGRWGEAVAEWPYAEFHRLELRHPLGSLPVIGRLFNRGPFPLPGSSTTVAAFPSPWPGLGQAIREGPTVRWVAVVGDGDRSLAVLPGGQSGHPFDPHYDDQLDLFLNGHTHPAAWSEESIARATVSAMRLVP
jgi:penicillin G amidase